MVLAIENQKSYEVFRRWKLYRVDEKCRKALKILISVVVGALLLAGLYMLFKDTILPTLTQRVKELFDYSGN